MNLGQIRATVSRATSPRTLLRVPTTNVTLYDLQDLDDRYRVMWEQHETLHRKLAWDMAAPSNPDSVLEVACGTGYNVPLFTGLNIPYFGADISETAIALATLKYPESHFMNLGALDLGRFKDDSFGVVYNSAMLEHIGRAEESLLEMARIAKRRLYVVFFEGLSDKPDSIKFTRYTRDDMAGLDIWGHKVRHQDHGQGAPGWFWNRYSEKTIRGIFERAGLRHEIRHEGKESVLVVHKG